jgi:GNAT superfamily N-acetyltransferase
MATLNVLPASLPDLLPVLRASALDCEMRGRPMWPQAALTEERLAQQYPEGQGFLGTLDGQPAATMILLPRDEEFWPGKPASEALYLHKLAVHPDWQKQNLSAQMIRAAVLEIQAAGREFLRLDTAAERTKLRAIYEGLGFHTVLLRFQGIREQRRIPFHLRQTVLLDTRSARQNSKSFVQFRISWCAKAR